ncbi:uncharacterized protein LOC130622996 isoform X10 [Hydractinia symbiolongicarpus]|uniref:uncharacterized protein LOC130622996 isoform X6 n=1 Tax=Hydractinia symbiolongicarpus TaxID=13093 RepID=UPI00254AFDD2|nr:uncharacterized protein LOC130622996 isoform X6 [Hydractinia symbiolongicarpus]XP_057294458.1 uncharacterized protein LOC130622996 isoform X7 [Hydractinia symbiolongicarpus]XP_057294459.1 uncharacterized protein LOC130622996 isoform X8 [Hydractinia symbiolongicarpus]XP_057294460.1 uncharacterized protein LOC130622996 isoform X9 [Hydractinia symbiolongicarpus]XP_057294461.1 uncharacterized protein LOC130622996 isoform X10 [Hydractinia symbiolongicarpus]
MSRRNQNPHGFTFTAAPSCGLFGATSPKHFGATRPRHFGATRPRHFGATSPKHFGATSPKHFGATSPKHFDAATQPTSSSSRNILTKDLLTYYDMNDETILLCGNDFSVPVKLGIIGAFMPAMQKYLKENKIPIVQQRENWHFQKPLISVGDLEENNIPIESNTKHQEIKKERNECATKIQRSIRMFDFDAAASSLLVNCLVKKEMPQRWSDVVVLLKISHFFEADLIIQHCYMTGEKLLSIDNDHCYEAIQLMTLYKFDNWCNAVASIIKRDNTWKKETIWDSFFNGNNEVMCKITRILFGNSTPSPERFETFNNMVTRYLLQYYVENDEKILLCGDGYNIPITLGVINTFIPVMKTCLETKVNESKDCTEVPVQEEKNDTQEEENDKKEAENDIQGAKNNIQDEENGIQEAEGGIQEVDNEKEKRNLRIIRVQKFDEDCVKLLVNCFQEEIWELDWSDMVKLLEVSHFYQAVAVIQTCYEIGNKLIQATNDAQHYYEAIELMTLYGFDDWCQEIAKKMRAGQLWKNEENWKALFTDNVDVMCKVTRMMSDIHFN